MTLSEESTIDIHILKATVHAYTALWSILDKDKTYYNLSLKDLLRDGYLRCSFTGADDIVGFTRILNHIGITFRYISNGIELKENAKIHYRDDKMYKKAPAPTTNNEKSFNRVGKEEPDESKLGWADRKRLNNI